MLGLARREGLPTVAERAGVDLQTARRYVEHRASGRAGPLGRLVDDSLVGQVGSAVCPARPNGHGASWEALLPQDGQIRAWVTVG